jgi:Flp pilus assembly protein TadD
LTVYSWDDLLQSGIKKPFIQKTASLGSPLQQRRFDEARPFLETLLQLEPEHPVALYNLGVLASEEGMFEEVRLLLRRAVVANADEPHAQANVQVALALAAMRLGDNAEARQALQAAIELEPQNSFAQRSLGGLLVIAGALAQALLELEPEEQPGLMKAASMAQLEEKHMPSPWLVELSRWLK